jgi:ribose transport system substrate-binding protein
MVKSKAVLAVAAVMAVCIAGVFSVLGSVQAKAAEVQPAKKVRIGVSIPAADHGWTAGVGWWAKRAMALYPEVEWVYATADKPEKQIADIEDMMSKRVDGLVVLATESGPLTPIARQAKRRGVFIVNVDRGFEQRAGEAQIADIFLEGDNKAFGRKSAQYMAEKLDGKGNIVILTGIPCTVDTDRVMAAREVFAQHPEIRILDQQPGNWNRQKALEVMENLLTKHPKIDAVWAADDDMALGVIQAIKERGRDKEMWVFGGGGMKEMVRKVMEKDAMVPANVTYSPSMIAAGIHTAVSVLRDGKKEQVMEFMPRHLLIDVELITPENAKAFYFPDAVY